MWISVGSGFEREGVGGMCRKMKEGRYVEEDLYDMRGEV